VKRLDVWVLLLAFIFGTAVGGWFEERHPHVPVSCSDVVCSCLSMREIRR
jgi:hypothetical protein